MEEQGEIVFSRTWRTRSNVNGWIIIGWAKSGPKEKIKRLKDFILWSYDIKNNIYNIISLYFYSLN